MKDLTFSSALQIAEYIRNGDISSEEITRHYIDRIETRDSEINAVPVRTFEQGIADAKAADQARAQGKDLGPLHGVPMTIKESYVLKDTPTTWGLPSHKDNVSDKDGLAVQRFRQAGAHFIGKTNVPVDLADFQSYNDIYGTTNNPWNTQHVPGGSSGGSGAALAAGFSALEAGSDIGGSIRTPAVFNGVYGHKATWGIIPQSGHELMPGVPDSDLSVCGPLARNAADLHVALDTMAGPTGREAVGWRLDLPDAPFKEIEGMRIAIWPTDQMAPVAKEIEERVRNLGETLAGLGATVSDTARPDFDVASAHVVYQNLLTAVMSSAQPNDKVPQMQAAAAALDPNDQSYGAISTRAAVMLHRQWIRHNFRRERLRQAWDAFFNKWDILIAPQFTVPAIPHDHRPFAERTIDVDGEARPYFEPIFWSGLIIASYLPSTAFPTGPGKAGLPIGLQAVSGPYRDHHCIEFARLLADEIGGFQAPPAFA